LNVHEAKYLLIGGYAVNYHGYVRSTADMDIWIGRSSENAKKVVKVIQKFGFDVDILQEELFLKEDQVIRMGVPPIRIEVLTSISGVEFDDCFNNRIHENWDDIGVNIINLEMLKKNKYASGRKKDLTDLDHLE
jgi:hypothetical protein